MHRAPSTRRAAARGQRFTGAALRRWITPALVLLLLLGTACYLLPRFSCSSEEAGAMMHRIQRGEFIREITLRGNVESANDVEVACQVPAHWDGRQWAGTMILWVIPEGTYIEPVPDWQPDPDNPDEDPPDLLVRLDASLLKNQRIHPPVAYS